MDTLHQEFHRDAFFDGDIALRKVFSESNHFLMSVGQECFNEVVSDVFKKPLDNRLIENVELRQTCADMGLTVTKIFKKQLETLHYMLELHVRSSSSFSIILPTFLAKPSSL